MDERTRAWIAENSGEDDDYLASGRFRAHIEIDHDNGPELSEELEDVALGEALRWARERSPVVLVRLWDSGYLSAGEVNPDPEHFPALPDEALRVGARRPRGLEALDNTENDPPVLWDLRLHVGGEADEVAFRTAVESDGRTLSVPREAVDERLDGVRVLVRASTEAQAQAIAADIFGRAVSAAGDPTASRTPRRAVWAQGYEVYPFAPDAPIIFGGGRVRVKPAGVESDPDLD